MLHFGQKNFMRDVLSRYVLPIVPNRWETSSLAPSDSKPSNLYKELQTEVKTHLFFLTPNKDSKHVSCLKMF